MFWLLFLGRIRRLLVSPLQHASKANERKTEAHDENAVNFAHTCVLQIQTEDFTLILVFKKWPEERLHSFAHFYTSH